MPSASKVLGQRGRGHYVREERIVNIPEVKVIHILNLFSGRVTGLSAIPNDGGDVVGNPVKVTLDGRNQGYIRQPCAATGDP
jgi:hypothetical protein